MIKTYDFEYTECFSEGTFVVNTEIFKEEDAQLLLDFFTWKYNKEANPIDELIKQWAVLAVKIAVSENYNEYGVKSWFKEEEGLMVIDGSKGVELTYISVHEFDAEYINLEIK